MNILLFDSHEMDSQGLVTVDGRRRDHLSQTLKVAPGDTLRAGVVNGPRGTATVRAIAANSITLAFAPGQAALPPHPTDLILALPRPIMLKRVLHQAAALGVHRIFLIRSRRVEKSFFQAHLLDPNEMKGLLLAGLEQGMDTRLPEVSVHGRFRPFLEDQLPAATPPGALRLLAHPGGSGALASAPPIAPERSVQLAIGPEGGWVDFEVEQFLAAGFSAFSLGPRILRVDTVLPYLFGQLDLLRAKVP